MKKKESILKKIGAFILKMNDFDYEKTERFLRYVEVTKVELPDYDTLVIMARRRSLLMGHAGKLHKAIEKELNIKLMIIQDTTYSPYYNLIPNKEL